MSVIGQSVKLISIRLFNVLRGVILFTGHLLSLRYFKLVKLVKGVKLDTLVTARSKCSKLVH